MAIEVTCPECSEEFNVPEKLSGKTIRCKACRGAVPVPSALPDYEDDEEDTQPIKRPAAGQKTVKADVSVDDDEDDEEETSRKTNPNRPGSKAGTKVLAKRRRDDDDDDEEDDDDRPRRKNKKSQSGGVPIALIAVGVLAIVGAVGGGVYFLTRDKKDVAAAGTTTDTPNTGPPQMPKMPKRPGAPDGEGNTPAGPGANQAASGDWQTFSEDGFRAELPGKPTSANTQNLAAGAQGISLKVYTLVGSAREEQFTISLGKMPLIAQSPQDAKNFFAGAVPSFEKSLVTSSGGKIKVGNVTDSTQDGFPGKDIQIVDAKGGTSGGTMRIVLARNRFFMYGGTANDLKAFQPKLDRFLNSVKLSTSSDDSSNMASGSAGSPMRPNGGGPGPMRPPGGPNLSMRPPGGPGSGPGNSTGSDVVSMAPGAGQPGASGFGPGSPPGGPANPGAGGPGGIAPAPGQPGASGFGPGAPPGGPANPGGQAGFGGTVGPLGGGPGGVALPPGGPGASGFGPGAPPGPAGGPGGGPMMPGRPGRPGSGPGMGGGAQSDPNPPPQGASVDGIAKHKIDGFYTAAFDIDQKDKPSFFTITSRLNKGAMAGTLTWYSYPTFETKKAFKLPHLASRAVIDSANGLLYIATLSNNPSAHIAQQYDLASGVGDVQVFDLKPIYADSVAANAELKPTATFGVGKQIRGLELSADGKSLFVVSTTMTGKPSSTLFKFDTETRKPETKTLQEPVWEMRKSADGKSLVVLNAVHGSTDKASLAVYNQDTLAPVREAVPIDGVGFHLASVPNSARAQTGVTVSGKGPNPSKLFMAGESGSHEMQLGIGWRATMTSPGAPYIEFTPDGKKMLMSGYRSSGLDLFEVGDIDSSSGGSALIKKASIRTAGGATQFVGGHIFVSPDSQFVVDHHGIVLDLNNIGGSNGEPLNNGVIGNGQSGPGRPGQPGFGPGGPGGPGRPPGGPGVSGPPGGPPGIGPNAGGPGAPAGPGGPGKPPAPGQNGGTTPNPIK